MNVRADKWTVFLDRVLNLPTVFCFLLYSTSHPEYFSSAAYYWAKIGKKEVDQFSVWKYNIDYADGDQSFGFTSLHLYRMREALSLMRQGRVKRDAPPQNFLDEKSLTPKGKRLNSGTGIPERPPPKTLEEMYETRCQTCSQCTKEDCSECFACKQNQSKDISRARLCCVKKMCSKFSILEKAQDCKDFLPDAWLYLFEDPKENPMYAGLIIVSVANLVNASKKLLRCKSFEGVANRCGDSFAAYDPDKFYGHLGLTPQSKSALIPKHARPRDRGTPKEFTPDPWTLRELSEKRCGDCENCLRTVCSKCDSCVQANGDICLRRVCYKISPEHKSQLAPYFPEGEGWRFFFDRNETKGKSVPVGFVEKLDGLILVAPNGRRYYSVESAVNTHKTLVDRVSTLLQFYSFAGIEITEAESKELMTPLRKRGAEKPIETFGEECGWGKRSRCTRISSEIETEDEPFEFPVIAPAPQELPFSPTELYKRRCKKCTMCLKESCGQCATCELNQSRTRKNKEVCLRKVRFSFFPKLSIQLLLFVFRSYRYRFSVRLIFCCYWTYAIHRCAR